MKYCCDIFSRLVENAGGKGFSVIHGVSYGERQFFLQCRPVDQDTFEYHSQIDPATGKNLWPEYRNKEGQPRSMGIISNQVMRFCLGCGKELNLFIKSNVVEFDCLVVQQLPLQ